MASSSSSVIGVSSIFHTPALELATSSCNSVRRTTSSAIASLPLPLSDWPHFNSLIAKTKTHLTLRHRHRQSHIIICSAIATPDSILSEEAFKGLGDLSDFGDAVYHSQTQTDSSPPDVDELAISKLGLPHRLVQTLEKRGITHLFPIQVFFLSLCPYLFIHLILCILFYFFIILTLFYHPLFFFCNCLVSKPVGF